jgi:hypothetical protein
VVAHLRAVADPDTAASQAERRHQQRGLWLSPTLDGMVAVDGLLEPEAGQALLAVLEPLAAQPTPRTPPAAASAGPTPSPNWPAGAWRPATCPRPVGPAPADGDGGPGQPHRQLRPRRPGRRHRLRTPGSRGLPAAGL